MDASIIRECGVPMADVDDMGLYMKMIVLGYKPPREKTVIKLVPDKPPEFRLPRVRTAEKV